MSLDDNEVPEEESPESQDSDSENLESTEDPRKRFRRLTGIDEDDQIEEEEFSAWLARGPDNSSDVELGDSQLDCGGRSLRASASQNAGLCALLPYPSRHRLWHGVCPVDLAAV